MKSEITVDSAGNLFLPAGVSTTKDLKQELLQSEDVKNLSTAALVNLVKKLESVQHHHVEKEVTGIRNGCMDGLSALACEGLLAST
ncbi:MAG: hypothetical protein VX367_11065 [SAR324 cluster bacterium]|nr:hypothetical protein [SAR324 cluster bacterium]